jgi:choline dehydrogenase-like flavoprotein
LLGNRAGRDADLAIWLNATVTSFDLNRETGRLRSVIAQNSGGKRVTVEATQFVICAGGVESTRLLLLMDLQHQDRPFRSCYALGRYLHDRVAHPIANIVVEGAGQMERLNRLAAPRFAGSTLRSPRFRLSPSAQKADGVTDAFGYITAECERQKGGLFWRESLRWFQSTDDVGVRLLPSVRQDLSAFAKGVVWRWTQKQLYWPTPSAYRLHVVAEQEPQSAHRINLGFERDAFGAPGVEIRWGRDQSTARAAAAFCRRFDRYWSRQKLDEIGKLEFANDMTRTDLTRTAFEPSPGEFHQPSGGARMGTNGVDAVVDRDLRAFSIPNLSVASRAVFPSSACGDPTLTLMLLSFRLAERLADVSRAA